MGSQATPPELISLSDLPPDQQRLAREILQQAKITQDSCEHDWEKITEYDPNYSPRVDGLGKGWNIITGFRCKKCNKHRKIDGYPWTVCRNCGGKMEFTGNTLCGEDRVQLHKCADCGHEFDTT